MPLPVSDHNWVRDGRTLVCNWCGNIVARATHNLNESYHSRCPNPSGLLGEIVLDDQDSLVLLQSDWQKGLAERMGSLAKRLGNNLKGAPDRSFTTFIGVVGATLTPPDTVLMKTVAKEFEGSVGGEKVAAWLFHVAKGVGYEEFGQVRFVEA